MATKRKVFLLLTFLFSIFFIIKIYDSSRKVGFGDHKSMAIQIKTDKTIYNTNEEILFSYIYTYEGTKKIGLNICTDNEVSIIMRMDTPLKSERDQFPKRYQIERTPDINDGINSIFNYACPENLTTSNGLILFNNQIKYTFNFKLTYNVEDGHFFLIDKNKKIELHQKSAYYYLYISLKEGIMSSDEASEGLGNYIYIKIEGERLLIFTP